MLIVDTMALTQDLLGENYAQKIIVFSINILIVNAATTLTDEGTLIVLWDCLVIRAINFKCMTSKYRV